MFIAHLGAAVEGNGIFLPDESVLLEIDSQQKNRTHYWPVFQRSGYGTPFAETYGITAMSVAVAYSENDTVIEYFRRSDVKLLVNQTRWDDVLKRLRRILWHVKSMPDTCQLPSHDEPYS